MSKINPFEQEENLKPWFEQDFAYQQHMKARKKVVMSRFESNSWLGYLKSTYINLAHFLTKNTVGATLSLIIALTVFSATAAQLSAPLDFKPTTIFKKYFGNNQVSQKDQNFSPYTSLISDSTHFVASLDTCDLSIKFPKQLASQELGLFDNQDEKEKGFESNSGLYYSAYITPKNDYNNKKFTSNLQSVTVSCSDQELPALDYNLINIRSAEDFKRLTGWFVAGETTLTNIRTESPLTAGPFRILDFKHGNKFYRFNFATTEISKQAFNFAENEDQKAKSIDPNSISIVDSWNKVINQEGLFGNQIQIQFNSLIKDKIVKAEIVKPVFDLQPKAKKSIQVASSSITQSISSKASQVENIKDMKVDFVQKDGNFYTYTGSDQASKDETSQKTLRANQYLFGDEKQRQEFNSKFDDYMQQSDSNLFSVSGTIYETTNDYSASNFKTYKLGNDITFKPLNYKESIKTIDSFKKLDLDDTSKKPIVKITDGVFEVIGQGNRIIKLNSGVEGLDVMIPDELLPLELKNWKPNDVITLSGNFEVLPSNSKILYIPQTKIAGKILYNKANSISSQSTSQSSSSAATETKSYINQYYPGLEINYDSSWKLVRNSEPNEEFSSLENGTVTFTKDSNVLTLKLSPRKYGDCPSKINRLPGMDGVKLSGTIFQRFGLDNVYEFLPNPGSEIIPGLACGRGKNKDLIGLIIPTTIALTDIPQSELNKINGTGKDGKVEYTLSVEYKGNSVGLAETEQILQKSKFNSVEKYRINQ
jgi:hypothetical protein